MKEPSNILRQLGLMCGARNVVAFGRFLRQRPAANVHVKSSMNVKRLLLDVDALKTSKKRISRHMIDDRAFKYV